MLRISWDWDSLKIWGFSRSHDGFITLEDGVMEPAPGSNYASQRRVFNDLGQGVLNNAFEGI